jgi:hypothetical protein
VEDFVVAGEDDGEVYPPFGEEGWVVVVDDEA